MRTAACQTRTSLQSAVDCSVAIRASRDTLAQASIATRHGGRPAEEIRYRGPAQLARYHDILRGVDAAGLKNILRQIETNPRDTRQFLACFYAAEALSMSNVGP